MDLFWYCRYPNGTARVSSADINSWTPLSKSMRRFFRNSVCPTNFFENPTDRLFRGARPETEVRTGVIFTYGTHFYFLNTLLVETCSLVLVNVKLAVPTVLLCILYSSRAPSSVQQESSSANSGLLCLSVTVLHTRLGMLIELWSLACDGQCNNGHGERNLW